MASADGSHVHCVPFETGGGQLCPCGIVTATPQAFTVTSRPNPTYPVGEFPVTDGCAPQTSPYPPSLGPAHDLRSFTHWFLSSTSVSRLPDPPHSVVLDRPGFVGAAFHLSWRLPGQAAPSYNGLRCDVTDPESFHLRYGTQRLVAHRGLGVNGDSHGVGSFVRWVRLHFLLSSIIACKALRRNTSRPFIALLRTVSAALLAGILGLIS